LADLNFGTTVNLLKNAIDGSGQTQSVIANNIANVNTPNYRRQTETFKDALAASLGAPPDPDQLGLVVDNPAHIPLNDGVDATPYTTPAPHTDAAIQMRVDKSNVDVDQEMAELAMNTGYQQTMAQLLKTNYSEIGTLLRENP
jgi:flagellar basal-body rod protein FlgB